MKSQNVDASQDNPVSGFLKAAASDLEQALAHLLAHAADVLVADPDKAVQILGIRSQLQNLQNQIRSHDEQPPK